MKAAEVEGGKRYHHPAYSDAAKEHHRPTVDLKLSLDPGALSDVVGGRQRGAPRWRRRATAVI